LFFWKIFLAHLLTDFIFQPNFIAKNKQKLKFLLVHILIFFLLASLLLIPNISFRVILLLFLLSIIHGIVDFIKEAIQIKFHEKAAILFIVDQLLHIISIGIFVEIMQEGHFENWGSFIDSIWNNPKVFIISSFVVLIVFGGGYLTGLICNRFIKDLLEKGGKPGLEKAGRYIGIFERSLIIVAVLIGRYEFIGFLIAAKSIARYPEISKELAFAEYFLVGTLTSVSIAIFGSLILLSLIS